MRVYAPVGTHEDLLAYLVRRLLENGANTSFVHRLVDPSVPEEAIIADPVARCALGAAAIRGFRCRGGFIPIASTPPASTLRIGDATPVLHAAIAPTTDQRRRQPRNSQSSRSARAGGPHQRCKRRRDRYAARCLVAWLARLGQRGWRASRAGAGTRRPIRSRPHATNCCRCCCARAARRSPTASPKSARQRITAAGTRCRPAEDFAAPRELPGPTGERNTWELGGRGVFAAISPWNFPLAIFTGQVAAALAAGNAVAAKPAEQTPLVAARAVALLHEAGVPRERAGAAAAAMATVGQALVRDPRIAGVAFTGGTDTARPIARALAARPGPIVPFIAETGGLNAMIVDSSALAEQVVTDVI